MRYSVGTVARVLGLTPGALHYYEREGLMNGRRTDSGRRYYDDADLWRLLSYEKYHSMEYPIKTVVDQFTGGGSRAAIEGRVRDCMEEARRKSEHYRQLALSIQAHIDGYERIDELMDSYAFERNKALWFWHADKGWMSDERAKQDVAARWVSAMPAAQIAILMEMSEERLEPDVPTGQATYGFAITPERARAIGFAMPSDAEPIKARSCLHTVVTCPHDFIYQPAIAFETSLDYLAKHNLTLDGDPFARVLLVETDPDGLFRAYVDVWTPIR